MFARNYSVPLLFLQHLFRQRIFCTFTQVQPFVELTLFLQSINLLSFRGLEFWPEEIKHLLCLQI